MRNLRNASSESGGGGRDAFPAARGARRTLHPEYERGTPQPHPAPASSVADRTLRSQPDTVGERLAVLRAGCEAPAPRSPRAPSTSAAEIALLPDFSDSLPADYRKGYGEWRSGNARGARGEPDTQPPPPVDVELERRAGDGPRRASTPPPTRCPHSNGHAMAGSVYIHTEVTSGVRGGIASPPGSPVGQLPVFTAAGERVADGRPRAADVLPRRSRSHSSDDSHASHAVTRAMRTIMPRLARIASGHRLAASDSSLPSYLAATSPYALRGSWPLRLVGRVKVSVFGASSSSLEVLSTSAIELSRADLVLDGRGGLRTAGIIERMTLIYELRRYMLPLSIVFWSEYACQSGAWTAFTLDGDYRSTLTNADARNRAYQYFNLMYQLGVLISRASGLCFTIGRPTLLALVGVQVSMLAAFYYDASTQIWVGHTLGLPALLVGLIGGLLYVQTFLAVDRELPAEKREAALATCTCGDTAGVLVGELTGLLMQWCLFGTLGLAASGQCPWQ